MASIGRRVKRMLHYRPFLVTFRYLFRRSFTNTFPYESTDNIRSPRFRGLLALNMANCVGCRACEKICPNKTIIMVTKENGDRYPAYFAGRCMLCGLCEESCHYDALFHTGEFEHAGYHRSDLYFSPERMNEVEDKYVLGRDPQFLEA